MGAISRIIFDKRPFPRFFTAFRGIIQRLLSASALHSGENTIELRRIKDNPGFVGAIEVRKCIVDLKYPNKFAPGSICFGAFSGRDRPRFARSSVGDVQKNSRLCCERRLFCVL